MRSHPTYQCRTLGIADRAPPGWQVTPTTRLAWSGLQGWLDAARAIERRAPSAARYRAADAHIDALTVPLIRVCRNEQTLRALVQLLRRSSMFQQPARGGRRGSKHAVAIVEANNALYRLERELVFSGHNRGGQHPATLAA